MSEFTVVEYDAFTVDTGAGEPPATRRPRPWLWGVVGLVVGLVVGFAVTVDLPEPTAEGETGPLDVRGTPGQVPTADTTPIPEATTVAQAAPELVGDIHVLVSVEDGSTAHARLLAQREDLWLVDPTVDPSSRADAGGNALARTVAHRGGTAIEARSALGFPGEFGTWLGDDVAGWAWSRTAPLTIAWSERPRQGATRIHHHVIGGPEREPLVLGGEWTVVDFVDDKAIVVSETSIGLADLDDGQLYARTAEAPVRVSGIFGGVVLGTGGPTQTPVQVDLAGTYGIAPAWWEPYADLVLADPGTGWGAQVIDNTVVVVDPGGSTEFITTTGTPVWSVNGRHLIVPQGSSLVIVDTRDGTRSRIDTGAPIESVWVS